VLDYFQSGTVSNIYRIKQKSQVKKRSEWAIQNSKYIYFQFFLIIKNLLLSEMFSLKLVWQFFNYFGYKNENQIPFKPRGL